MSLNRKLKAFLTATLAVSALAMSSPTHAQDFYKGKRIMMVVGLAPGGGLDIMARLFSKHLAKHIAGSPDIVVQNMPGAAGATAMNFMATKAPNGQ